MEDIPAYLGTTPYDDTDVAIKYGKHLAAKIYSADAAFLDAFVNFLNTRRGCYLDLGSGMGHLANQLQQKLIKGRVIGVEPANYFFEKACESYPEIEFHQLVGSEILSKGILEQDSLDGIMAIQVLPNINDEQELLKMIDVAGKLLKYDGIFMLTDINPLAVSQKVVGKTIKIYTDDNFDGLKPGARYYSDRLLLDNDWIKQANRFWPLSWLKEKFAMCGMEIFAILEPRPKKSEIMAHPELDNDYVEYIIYIFRKQ